MKILVISQMFPCRRHPTSAIFFANLMNELALKIDDLIIVTPRPYIPKILTKFKKKWAKWYLDPMVSKGKDMEIIRPYYLSLQGVSNEGMNGYLMYYSLLNLVKKLIIERKIDLILGYNMIPDGIAAVRLAKRFNLPSGFWAIGTDVNDFARYSKSNYYLTKKCIQDSDLIITESKDLENKIRELGCPNGKVHTFYKGIDLSNFQDLPSKDSLFNKLQLNTQKKYILFVGRLIYDKGIYELIQVFKNIAKEFPYYELILIGEEIEEIRLRENISELGLKEKVHFKGILSHGEVANYMKISDILVLPTWAEGLPNVILEAMATGLPVVATNVGGIPEVLQDGFSGLSVPVKNVDELTKAAIRMIKDDGLRIKCIRNAKKLIYDKYDVKKNVPALYELLHKIKINYTNNN